jgi:uncharacterized membrane protein YccC
MLGIDASILWIILAVLSALFAFGCYVAAQRSPRGLNIAGCVIGGLVSLYAVQEFLETALTPLASIGAGALGLLLIFLLADSSRGPHSW